MEVAAKALELTALIYDAALATEKWQAFMARMAESLRARSALLREVDYDAGEVGLFETVGFDPVYVAAYRNHFVHLDYFGPTIASAPIGVSITGDQVVPWVEQRKTEFCNDYLLAQKNRYVLGNILSRDDRYHLLFAAQREEGQQDFSREDLELVRLLAPHMARAAHIHRRMNDLAGQKHWTECALDCLRVGVVLLDGRGRVQFLNRAAERLASGRRGLVAGREGLSLPGVGDTARLRRLIADAAGLATGRKVAAGGCLRAAGGEGAMLQLQVIPLPQGLSERPTGPSLDRSCVAVFVSTLGASRLPGARLMAMYGLTRAEARLAALLAEGLSLEEAADVLLVSIQTVRSQLKLIFAKTDVRRQAELVALLLTDMLSDQAGQLAEVAT